MQIVCAEAEGGGEGWVAWDGDGGCADELREDGGVSVDVGEEVEG